MESGRESGHGEWTGRVDRESGERERESGHGELTERVDRPSGQREWRGRVEMESGQGEWRGKVDRVTTTVSGIIIFGIERTSATSVFR